MKVNINYPLEGEAFAFAAYVNAWFIDHGSTAIVFGDGGPYPHVTLLMGEISPHHFEELTRRIGSLACELVTDAVRLTGPYRPAVDSRYVFMGIEPSTPIISPKRLLADYLEDIFTPAEFGGVDTTPHITVAYISSLDHYRTFLPADFTGLSWRPEVVAIAESGEHGVCKKTIADFNLRSAKQDKSSIRGRQRR